MPLTPVGAGTGGVAPADQAKLDAITPRTAFTLGTATVTGTTPPSGLESHTATYSTMNGTCKVRGTLFWATPGSGVTLIEYLPTGLPAPLLRGGNVASPTYDQLRGNMQYVASNTSNSFAGAVNSAIIAKATTGALAFRLASSSISIKQAEFTGEYEVA